MIDQYVYIKDDEYHWVPALLIHQTAEEATVAVGIHENESQITGDYGDSVQDTTKRTVKLADYPNRALPLQNTATRNKEANTVHDMIELSFLHEASILYNLKSRHAQAMPYTRTGDIVIAVNPYQWFPSLYLEENRVKYSKSLVWEASKKDYDARRDLQPHVYETSALAYRGLAMAGINQSILVSGESGAGKTETVKICMDHLASVVQNEHEQDKDASQDQTVITKILDSNPLLEAFGNAKTRRNDNSSRFGKYIRLQFQRGKHHKSHLTLLGSECQVYLLEKSRVVRHESSERTFHIFYQLLAAPNKLKMQFWSKLKGATNSSFTYVGETETTEIDGISDAQQFEKTLQSLAIIGIKDEVLQTFMQALCVVLQLGNIQFGPHSDDSDQTVVTSKKAMYDLAWLMGVAADKLESVLTKRLVKVRMEETSVPLNQESAKDSVDALAKQIYDRVFLWLVRRINEATSARTLNEEDFGIIGLLDIFGFESFTVNSFEQLCINYANEQLQQKFTQDVFISVFEEYKEEGIDLDEIQYDDNSDVLDLIQNKAGLLAMLNEECIRPNGSDSGFVNKALHANKQSQALIVPRIRSNVEFGIRHYAADVMYDASDFVSKNQDTLPTDLMEAACSSSNNIIATELRRTEFVQKPSKLSSMRSARRSVSSNLVAPTVWSKYKNQLKLLMEELNQSESRYIRCIKPNTFKKPFEMDHGLTLEQLRSSGVISAVTLSRSAFPNRLDHRRVLDRFSMFWPRGTTRQRLDKRTECAKLLDFALKPLEDGHAKAFVIGVSKAYFRRGALEYLEASRLKGMEMTATFIQSIVRGYFGRQLAQKEREIQKALIIQLAWRSSKARRQLLDLRLSKERERKAVMIQSCVRMFLAKLEREKRHAKYVKREAKRSRKKRKLEKLEQAATQIQNLARGFLVREKYRSLFEKSKQRLLIKKKIELTRAKIAKNERKAKKQVEKAKKSMEQDRKGRESWNQKVTEMKLSNVAAEETAKMIQYLQGQQRSLQSQVLVAEKEVNTKKTDFGALMKEGERMRFELDDLHSKNEKLSASRNLYAQKKNHASKETYQSKREIRSIQTQFLPVVNTRVEFQNAYQRILDLVDLNCKHAQLREDIMQLGSDCLSSISSLQEATKAQFISKKVKQTRMLGGSFSNVPAPKTPLTAIVRKKKKRLTVAEFRRMASP